MAKRRLNFIYSKLNIIIPPDNSKTFSVFSNLLDYIAISLIPINKLGIFT